MAISLSQGGLKISRRKELVAQERKIIQIEIAHSNDYNVQFFQKFNLFHELERIKQLKSSVPIIRRFHKLERVRYEKSQLNRLVWDSLMLAPTRSHWESRNSHHCSFKP